MVLTCFKGAEHTIAFYSVYKTDAPKYNKLGHSSGLSKPASSINGAFFLLKLP